MYSALHLRDLPGDRLPKTCRWTGCDPAAAQEMRPEYVKSILAPLGMLAHPVVVISDNLKGSERVLSRLLADPNLGPIIRVMPAEARWLGGDMTLAVMVSACESRAHCIFFHLPFWQVHIFACGARVSSSVPCISHFVETSAAFSVHRG